MPQAPCIRLPKESARDYAFRSLVSKIILLDYKPGTLVSINDLADDLGVSRTPVREAILELEKSGIIDVFPQAGSRISYIDYQRVYEERFIRLTLEKAVVGLACRPMMPLEIMEAEEMLASQENCLKLNDKNKLLALDNLFHRYLHQLANKMVTFHCVERLRYHSDRVRRLTLDNMDAAVVVSDHHAIFAAVKQGDAQAAQVAMAVHLGRFQDEESTIRHKYPEYFS